MTAILAIARRELDGYFSTPLGWVALTGFVFITGFFFAFFLFQFNQYAVSAGYDPYGSGAVDLNEVLLPMFFGNWMVVLLLMCPAVSMRIFAEDRGQRSFELLLSSPVSSGAIVLGKFLGAMGFLAVTFASTLYQPAVLYWLGNPDPGVLTGSYLSMMLFAACCISVGMLASAFTRSQIIAFMVTFAALLVLFLLPGLAEGATAEWMQVLGEVGMGAHIEDFGKGLVHTADLVYFATFVGACLFATQQKVESFRWQ
jgi:ABC-2 type transport system permease protein